MAKDYARTFYDSQAWRRTREAYLQSKHYICEDCGGTASVVHHITYIKPWNVNDPSITLNWDNLKAVCEKCHAEEHSRDLKKRGGEARLNGIAFDEEGNVIKQANVFLVCGSPASGKTTYVAEHKRSNDLVVDVDYICAALAGETCNVHLDHMLLIICAFAILCGLLFLLDFLHNRYHDDLLEQITLTARLQHQLLKLRNILTAQNQMLEQEKEQIKTLISDISHQIKTPVSAANTFAQLLDDKELSDEERSEYIATLQTSLEKLTFLTNSLIKMSRLESGIISLKPEKNSLNDIVLQAVKTVYAKAKEKNITITFDCEQSYEALLDYNWTAEAITNILDNAVKYTPSGGIVGLEITEYPSYLRLDISDNGIGIPEEEQAKIFGRFYRGKQSAGIDGVGIGLYLTRDIINKQKGYIKVASDENGSVFSLFLKKD